MEKNKFNEHVQKLWDQVEEQSQKKVLIEYNNRDEDWLAFDQSGHKLDDAGNINIILAKSSNPNFTLAHELWHILIEMSKIPTVTFPITTGNPEVDDQIKTTAGALIGSAEHIIIIKKQKEAGELTEDVKKDFLKGIDKKVPAEKSNDQLFLFRILMLLDALTFDQENVNNWSEKYPKVFPVAEELFEELNNRMGETAFAIRRSEVDLLNNFNNVLSDNKYEQFPYNDMVAIEPVLSERQLRLTLEQVFQIKHTTFNSLNSKTAGFILIGSNDQQNAGELVLQQNINPDGYRLLYQTTVKDFLTENNIKYILR